MPEIICDVSIDAPTAKVYEALTEQIHVERWWTECFLKKEVSSTAVFFFRRHGGYKRMVIRSLVENRIVEWECLDHYLNGDTDWIGTTIRFTLCQNKSGGTDLHFEHLNWRNKSGCYLECTSGWQHFVQESLKQYLETGHGFPYELQQVILPNELQAVSK